MDTKGLKRVGEIVPGLQAFEGAQVKVRDLVDKEFVITRIEKLHGENGPYLAVQAEAGERKAFFFTAHKVIMGKLAQCIDVLPVVATIRRIEPDGEGNTYFDIE